MHTALFVAVMVLAGCGERDPIARLEACSNDPCRLAALPPAWDADPELAWTTITTTAADPLAQATMVAWLAARRPGALEGRCTSLPGGGPQERCLRLTRRPHLRPAHGAGTQPDAAVSRQGRGPANARVPLPSDPATVGEPGCDDVGTYDCAFLSAERAVLEGGLQALERALGLCAHSAHDADCAEHCLELALPPVPVASPITQDMLEQARAAVIRYRAVAGDPRHADLYEGWLWSVWLGSALGHDDAGLPPPAAMPSAALPHLRFAAAWQVVRADEPAAGFDLDALTRAAQGAMDDFTLLTSQPGAMRPATITQTRHSWNGNRPGEGAVDAAWCMGSTRRASHVDAQIDLRIAVLEALARLDQPPPASAFLALVHTDEPESVRWTAARIGAVLDPEAAGSLDVSSETSALVLGRLAPGKGPKGP